jgi:very-short-patch-repair endonuclease
MSTAQVFSHLTAAELWGLPLPLRCEGALDLHVSALRGREPRRPGIVGHRIRDAECRILRGLVVVDPLVAWVQSAAYLGLDDLVAMADALLGRWPKEPAARLSTPEALATAVERRPGTRGAVALREALALMRHDVMSPRETSLRLLLQRAGLPEPELNVDVREGGVWLAKPDLVYRAAKVAVEYEGDYHRTSRTTFESDILRRERCHDAGWHMIRVTSGDLELRPAELVARVSRWVAR